MCILAATVGFECITSTECTCPGDTLTYQCTTMDSGTTVWKGSAFDCQSQSDQILLFHSRFIDGAAMGECNDGLIIGRGIGVSETGNSSCYSSQLNVTVSSYLNGMSIECFYDDGGTQKEIGRSRIATLSGDSCRITQGEGEGAF